MNRRTIHSSIAVVGVLSLAMAGCAKGDQSVGTSSSQVTGTAAPSGDSSTAASASPTPSTTPAAVTLSTAHGLTGMLPTDSLNLTATNGTVKQVVVTDPDGKSVAGTLTGSTWKPSSNLLPQTTYTADVTLADSTGATQQVKKTFSTLKTNIAGYDMLYTGNTLGVGMPATIQFVSAVESKAMRAEVEKHVKISVTPAQEGSWGWLDDRQLMWRPKTYWKPGTKVTMTANLAGLQTGPNKWIGTNQTGSFSIGDSRILYTDIANHTMRVTLNGKTIKTIPVTDGKPGFTTRSGIKVIIERDNQVKMDSSTVDIPAGSPDAYSLMVKYAMRLTWTGEFIHAAPWSVASQGVANVSHGCTGVSTANAQWLFNFDRAGDVDVVTGSNRIMKPTEGIGVWMYSWPQWQKQSALA